MFRAGLARRRILRLNLEKKREGYCWCMGQVADGYMTPDQIESGMGSSGHSQAFDEGVKDALWLLAKDEAHTEKIG